MTPEREAEIEAEILAFFGPPPPKPKPPKPKVVVSDTRNAAGRPEVIRDADVPVHPRDPNARHATDGVVAVRRQCDPINMDLATAQYWERVNAQAAQRPPGRDVDPMGVWGRTDE